MKKCGHHGTDACVLSFISMCASVLASLRSSKEKVPEAITNKLDQCSQERELCFKGLVVMETCSSHGKDVSSLCVLPLGSFRSDDVV